MTAREGEIPALPRASPPFFPPPPPSPSPSLLFLFVVVIVPKSGSAETWYRKLSVSALLLFVPTTTNSAPSARYFSEQGGIVTEWNNMDESFCRCDPGTHSGTF
jgi:hypothetical protein